MPENNKNFELHIDEEKMQREYSENSRESNNLKNKQKKKHLKNKLKKSPERVKLFKIVFVAYIISMVLMLGQFFVFGTCDMLAMTREENVVTIEIPKNSSQSKIANILYDKGVIKEKSFFKLFLILTGGAKKVIPGTYEIKTNKDYQGIISFLQSNSNRLDSDLVDLTIPEGKNILEIAELLEKNEICTKDEFIKECQTTDFNDKFTFLKDLNNNDLFSKVEGCLFPDTYKFYKNIEPDVAIKKFLNNFEKKIFSAETLDDDSISTSIKEQADKKGMSLKDLIIMASIIQAEAANEDDMYNVSSVIHNRLDTIKNSGKSQFGDFGLSRLEMDSTMYYPYKSKDKIPENIAESFKSKYNTYEIEGLPVGPVCNSGLVAIDAALNPKNTQFYYFCHDKDKKPYYAKTLSEHEANLKKAGLRS